MYITTKANLFTLLASTAHFTIIHSTACVSQEKCEPATTSVRLLE